MELSMAAPDCHSILKRVRVYLSYRSSSLCTDVEVPNKGQPCTIIPKAVYLSHINRCSKQQPNTLMSDVTSFKYDRECVNQLLKIWYNTESCILSMNLLPKTKPSAITAFGGRLLE
jgi:hypothetical protein